MAPTSIFPAIVKGRISLKTRGSTEIIGLILQAVECESLTRSKIMYQAILNFKQVSSYTVLLADEGLLKYLDQDRKYAITDKGKEFLRLFRETNKLLNTSIDEMEAAKVEQNVQQHEVTLHK
jgi:predicted transcriptional regulator